MWVSCFYIATTVISKFEMEYGRKDEKNKKRIIEDKEIVWKIWYHDKY